MGLRLRVIHRNRRSRRPCQRRLEAAGFRRFTTDLPETVLFPSFGSNRDAPDVPLVSRAAAAGTVRARDTHPASKERARLRKAGFGKDPRNHAGTSRSRDRAPVHCQAFSRPGLPTPDKDGASDGTSMHLQSVLTAGRSLPVPQPRAGLQRAVPEREGRRVEAVAESPSGVSGRVCYCEATHTVLHFGCGRPGNLSRGARNGRRRCGNNRGSP